MIPVLLTRQLGIGLDDMFQYDMLARSLAAGNGFRWYAPADQARLEAYLHHAIFDAPTDPRGILTTFRAPLYPAFLSLVYTVNGINDGRFFAARLAQTLLGALLAPLTYFVALRIPLSGGDPELDSVDGERSARLASRAVAAYPMLLLFPVALATENLFFLLVLASVLALLRLAAPNRGGKLGSAMLAGVLLGLSALTRSVILPFAGAAFLWMWFSLRLRAAALLAAVTLLITIMPWIIRNSLVEHKLTGIETSAGYNLYVGYHPQSTGTFVFGPSLELLAIPDDRERDEIGTQLALEFVKDDPARFPYLVVRRLGYFFNLELRAFSYFYGNDFLGYIPLPLLLGILLLLALPFAALGLSAALGWPHLTRRPESMLLLLLVVFYLFPHILVLSEERFHLALVPVAAVSAAAFWVRGLSTIRLRSAWVVSAAILIAALLLANWGLQLGREGPMLLKMLGPNGNQLYLPY